jgi:hypothetical protein
LKPFRNAVVDELKESLLKTGAADLVDQVVFLGGVVAVKCCDIYTL